MTSAALQLALEDTLGIVIAADDDFPAAVGVQSAHALEKASAPDFLFVIAELPDWNTYAGINAIVRVTFQLCTGVADNEKRPAQATAGQERLGVLLDLFTVDDINATRDALNAAGIAKGIGFTGWSGPLPESEDGQNDDSKQLAPKLIYEFEIFRL